eukprot:TRINITY_DN6246_c0_g1_i4.p1 TRINITY_DN6246_c0_g1~~TRINITY_DN6246_c0_g1_i4.p1  ORF type:complete len:186 (+),score=36.48 TRINITY_DN6246_c0_g1_i4:621-1178(+)
MRQFKTGNVAKRIMEYLEVIVYDDDYPTELTIDTTGITPLNPIRVGHIPNLLPDGIFIHPRYKKHMIKEVFASEPIQDALQLQTEDRHKAFKRYLEMGYDEFTAKGKAYGVDPNAKDPREGMDESLEESFEKLTGERLVQQRPMQPREKKYRLRKTMKKVMTDVHNKLKAELGGDDKKAQKTKKG